MKEKSLDRILNDFKTPFFNKKFSIEIMVCKKMVKIHAHKLVIYVIT